MINLYTRFQIKVIVLLYSLFCFNFVFAQDTTAVKTNIAADTNVKPDSVKQKKVNFFEGSQNGSRTHSVRPLWSTFRMIEQET